eukprot:scaffold371514_cov34-Prasinocladus_malaysianus.AAC.2
MGISAIWSSDRALNADIISMTSSNGNPKAMSTCERNGCDGTHAVYIITANMSTSGRKTALAMCGDDM